jgi:hypothetical protein
VLQQLQQSYLNSLSADEPGFLSHLQPLATLSMQQSLELYHQGAERKALRVLQGIYRICHKILGLDHFNTIASEYIAYSPPTASNTDFFASGFVKFITGYPLEADSCFVAEVARLEWDIHLLVKEIDSPELDLEALAQVPDSRQGEIRFHLPVGATLLQSQYPLDQVLGSNQQDAANVHIVDLNSEEFYFILWRDGWQVYLDQLAQEEWLILQRIQMEFCFAEVGEYFAIHCPSIDITEIFPRLVAQGWIASFDVPDR